MGKRSSECRLLTVADMDRLAERHERKMAAAFEHDAVRGYITIKIDYPYHIELSRIRDKGDLLGWALHLCHKRWMNTEFLGEFIARVCAIKGWNAAHL